MTDLLDAALAKIKAKPEPYVFGAPSIVPKEPMPFPLFDLTDEAIDAATLAERDAIIADLEKWGMLRLPHDPMFVRFHGERVGKECGFPRLPECDGVYYTMLLTMSGKPVTLTPIYTTSEKDTTLGPFTREELEAQVATGESGKRIVVNAGIHPNVIVDDRGRTRTIQNLHDADKEHASTSSDMAALAAEALTILIASLACRNVIKEERHSGRRTFNGISIPIYERHGITYLSRTVVRPPPADEMDMAEGRKRIDFLKPRMVRGHIRNQVSDTTVTPQPPETRITVLGKGRTGRREQWIAPFYVNVDRDYGGSLTAPHYKVKP